MKTHLPHVRTLQIALGLVVCLLASATSYAQTVDTRFKLPTVTRQAYYYTLYEQNDGKIVIGGSQEFFGTKQVGSLVRLNRTGSLDRSFRTDYEGYPTQIVSFAASTILVVDGDYEQLIHMTKNGRVLSWLEIEAERVLVLPGNSFLAYADGVIRKYSQTFVQDMTFGTDGELWVDGNIYDMKMQGANVILAGSFEAIGDSEYYGIARISQSGVVDESFNTGSGTSDGIGSVTVQPDGKILLGNSYIYWFDGNWIGGETIRLNSDGSIDWDFNSDWWAPANIFYTSRNKIVIASQWGEIMQFNADGSEDENFNYIELDDYTDYYNAYAGKYGIVVLNGWHDEDQPNTIQRYTIVGNHIGSFNPSLAEEGEIYTMKAVGSQLVIGGDFSAVNGFKTYDIARLNSNGAVDASFQNTSDVGAVLDIQAFSDGSVLAKNYWYNFTKFNTNGSWGTFTMAGSGFFGQYYWSIPKYKITSDDKVVIMGSWPNYGIGRRTSTGAVDGTFTEQRITGATYWTQEFDLQADDKVIYGGDFSSLNSVSAKKIVRLNTDGTRDNTFDVGTAPNYYITRITVLEDQSIFVEGYFQSFGGTSANNFALLNSSGAVNTAFRDTYGNYFYVWSYGYPTMAFRGGFAKYTYKWSAGQWGLYQVNADGTPGEDLIPAGAWFNDSPMFTASADQNTLFTTQLYYNDVIRPVTKIDLPALPVEEPEAGRMPTEDMHVFPNPSVDAISFDIQKPIRVAIYGLDGSLKMETRVNSAEDKINVSGLQPGRYVVKMIVNGKTKTQHLVKN